MRFIIYFYKFLMPPIPAAEIHFDTDLVRELLQEAAPHLAGEKLWSLQEGWDNTIYRLGDKHCVRLPRREVAFANVLTEQRWLPKLSTRLPLPIPKVIVEGKSTDRYPWPWSVLSWVEGKPLAQQQLLDSEAEILADFLRKLHQPAPSGLASSEIRGCHMEKRSPTISECLKQMTGSETGFLPMINTLWQEALDATLCQKETWIHGDFHALNVLATNGKLSGVIDWGDLCRGDPATDLACIWMLLHSAEARHRAVLAYQADEPDKATWRRAKGWAVFFGVVLLTADASGNSPYPEMGRITLQNLAEDN